MKVFNKTSKKNGVLSGLLWAFGERITAQLVSLVVTIVLARLLDPEHYAPISIVTIFITIANTFVTAGFGNSLIQKKNADALDFSTTLIFSFTLSVLFYSILFFCAPLVARYYDQPVLTPVLRVMSLRIIVASINSVQHAYVSKRKEFRKFFFSTLGGTIVSAVVGIVMAYHGFGVWALVGQYLTNTTIDTVVLAFTCGWKPTFQFSFTRMKSLYSYGWKLLVSELIGTVYTELRGIVLSTNFAPVELSYYNQGRKYPNLFLHNVEASTHKVLFQKLSDVQDEISKVKWITRETIEISTFILCPIYFGLASCGKTVIILILTEKWLPCVPYMQIICFTALLHPIFSAHTRAMKALGKSKTFLIISIIRYSLGISFLFLSLVFIKEPHTVIISTLIAFFLTCICCGYVSRKYIGYSFKEQLQDVYITLLIGLVMLFTVQAVGRIHLSEWASFAVQVLTGVAVYVPLSLIFNKKLCRKLLSILKEKIVKKK